MHWLFVGLLVTVFGAGTGLIFAANKVFHTIIDEINTNRPHDQQIDWLWTSGRYNEILRRHAELFPGSWKRRKMLALSAVGIVLEIAAVLLGLIRG